MHETLTPPDNKGEAFSHYADLPDTAMVGVRQVDTMVEGIPLYGLKRTAQLYRLDVFMRGKVDHKWLLVFLPLSAHGAKGAVYSIIDTRQPQSDQQGAGELFNKLPEKSVALEQCYSPHWESEASKVQLVAMFYPHQAEDIIAGTHGGAATLVEVTFEHDEGLLAWLRQAGAVLKKLAEGDGDAPPEPRWVPRPV